MTPVRGEMAVRNGGLLEKFEPWWPTFRTSIVRSWSRSAKSFSTDALASPVSSALKPP
jgi:hypothetical protein